MAKKKVTSARVSKSDAIRDVLAAQPDASVKQIKAKLTAKGITASDALINKLKYTRKSSGSQKRSTRNSGTSKADAIRGMFERLGHDARPRDVIAALKARGVIVTSAQVSMLRGKLGQNGSTRSQVGGAVPYEHLVAAKQLAHRLGGVEKARQALESFARLVQA